MYQISTRFGSTFIVPTIAACALAAGFAGPVLGQSTADGAPVPPTRVDGAPIPPAGKDVVKVDDYGTVDIAVQDTDLAQVLQMLAIHSKKNIITSKSVSATVTANLYGVTLYEALDAILRVNGYVYVEEGNFIYIYTREEKAAQDEALRRRESRIFVLDHLAALDASEFITPLLSDVGQASARGEVEPGMKPDVTDGGADSYAFSAAIVVNDYPENLEAIGELLQELDTPPQQVLVEATVLQTAVDEANAFGIDFSAIGSLDFLNLTNPLSAVPNLLQGNETGPDVKATQDDGFQPGDNRAFAATSSVGNSSGPAGLKIGVLTDDISVFLRVLDQVSDNTVLARPRIMALNRQRAEVLVGARVGYLSTTATETTTTQTVEFLDTGIQLIFRPFISKDGTIRMELKPSVSEARLRDVTDSNGQLVTIPDELTNELTTNVRIRDGETLVLGGLFKENIRKERRQLPYLGDVPLLGAAFRGHDDVISRSEIIFLITPTVVKDDLLWRAGQQALDQAEIARVGTRAGLLPWSQESMTSNHNQDAAEALAAGDEQKALHHINSSLQLNPNQPEMIQLRDEVKNQSPSRVHERSLLQRLINKELQTEYGTDQSDNGSSVKPSSSAAPVADPFAPQAKPAAGAAFQPDATTSAESAAATDSATPSQSYTTGQQTSHSDALLDEMIASTGGDTEVDRTSGTDAPFNTADTTTVATADTETSVTTFTDSSAPDADTTDTNVTNHTVNSVQDSDLESAPEGDDSPLNHGDATNTGTDSEILVSQITALNGAFFRGTPQIPWARLWFQLSFGRQVDQIFTPDSSAEETVASVDESADEASDE